MIHGTEMEEVGGRKGRERKEGRCGSEVGSSEVRVID